MLFCLQNVLSVFDFIQVLIGMNFVKNKAVSWEQLNHNLNYSHKN